MTERRLGSMINTASIRPREYQRLAPTQKGTNEFRPGSRNIRHSEKQNSTGSAPDTKHHSNICQNCRTENPSNRVVCKGCTVFLEIANADPHKLTDKKRFCLDTKSGYAASLMEWSRDMDPSLAGNLQDLLTKLENSIIPIELYSMILGVAYYATKLFKKTGDTVVYAEHLACCALMIPMCGVGVMGDENWMPPLEKASWYATLASLGAWGVTATSRFLQEKSIRPEIRIDPINNPDFHHAIMFYCMYLMYKEHTGGFAGDYETYKALKQISGLACAVIGAKPLINLIKNPKNLKGMARLNQFLATWLHFVMFVGTAGMSGIGKEINLPADTFMK